mmetsp:Transcript_23422/g.40520  ORF Transcript_23422/g.40520 Transcript_23422/m.40520 type:complete len:524 (+) Transcript_23422:1464-3035(+)
MLSFTASLVEASVVAESDATTGREDISSSAASADAAAFLLDEPFVKERTLFKDEASLLTGEVGLLPGLLGDKLPPAAAARLLEEPLRDSEAGDLLLLFALLGLFASLASPASPSATSDPVLSSPFSNTDRLMLMPVIEAMEPRTLALRVTAGAAGAAAGLGLVAPGVTSLRLPPNLFISSLTRVDCTRFIGLTPLGATELDNSGRAGTLTSPRLKGDELAVAPSWLTGLLSLYSTVTASALRMSTVRSFVVASGAAETFTAAVLATAGAETGATTGATAGVTADATADAAATAAGRRGSLAAPPLNCARISATDKRRVMGSSELAAIPASALVVTVTPAVVPPAAELATAGTSFVSLTAEVTTGEVLLLFPAEFPSLLLFRRFMSLSNAAFLLGLAEASTVLSASTLTVTGSVATGAAAAIRAGLKASVLEGPGVIGDRGGVGRTVFLAPSTEFGETGGINMLFKCASVASSFPTTGATSTSEKTAESAAGAATSTEVSTLTAGRTSTLSASEDTTGTETLST